MAAIHEEEVLGKAYDSKLMRRLLTYLRPYRLQVIVALIAIILKAGADVFGPYLTKAAIKKPPPTPPEPLPLLALFLSINQRAGTAQTAAFFLVWLLRGF